MPVDTARADRWGWLGVTIVGIALAELFVHFLPLPRLVGTVILLAALLGPVYAGLRAGARQAIFASVLIAFYTFRFTAEPGQLVNLGASGVQGAVSMLLLGVGMGLAMARIKRREDALKDALREKAADLEKRNHELAEANATLEAFAYVVSHDLKEPVRAIDNYLLATEEEYGTPDGRTYLARAHQANQRLITLLRGLLDYSRVSVGGADHHDIRLDAVLDSEACRTMFDTLLEERGARLHVEGELPTVRGDETVLAQLLGNLILNAVKHNPGPDPRVWIRPLGRDNGYAAVAVDDNGPGFPDDLKKRLERDELRAGSFRGGFGLLIAQRAARRLGARLRAERSPEGGARVALALPAAKAAAAEPAGSMLQRGRQ